MTGPIGFEDLRADTVRQVAKLMAAAAITAPKSGGQLFLAGKHNFMETVIVDDAQTCHELAEWMRAAAKSGARRFGFATPTSPKPSTPCCSSAWSTGTASLRLHATKTRSSYFACIPTAGGPLGREKKGPLTA